MIIFEHVSVIHTVILVLVPVLQNITDVLITKQGTNISAVTGL